MSNRNMTQLNDVIIEEVNPIVSEEEYSNATTRLLDGGDVTECMWYQTMYNADDFRITVMSKYCSAWSRLRNILEDHPRFGEDHGTDRVGALSLRCNRAQREQIIAVINQYSQHPSTEEDYDYYGIMSHGSKLWVDTKTRAGALSLLSELPENISSDLVACTDRYHITVHIEDESTRRKVVKLFLGILRDI